MRPHAGTCNDSIVHKYFDSREFVVKHESASACPSYLGRDAVARKVEVRRIRPSRSGQPLLYTSSTFC